MKDSKGWDGKLRLADDSDKSDKSDNESEHEPEPEPEREDQGAGAAGAGADKMRAQITNPQALHDPNYNDPEMTMDGEMIEADEGTPSFPSFVRYWVDFHWTRLTE